MGLRQILNSISFREIDAIIGKATHSQIEHRYDSAEASAVDVQACLSGEVVAAYPDRLEYRAWKFLVGNLAWVFTLAFCVVTLTGGLLAVARQRDSLIIRNRELHQAFSSAGLEVRSGLGSLDELENREEREQKSESEPPEND